MNSKAFNISKRRTINTEGYFSDLKLKLFKLKDLGEKYLSKGESLYLHFMKDDSHFIRLNINF